jgi:hypothetical protein
MFNPKIITIISASFHATAAGCIAVDTGMHFEFCYNYIVHERHINNVLITMNTRANPILRSIFKCWIGNPQD